MKERFEILLKSFNELMKIYDADGVDWHIKYDLIFKMHSDFIQLALTNLGIELDWYDPDTSYQKDTVAYVPALCWNFNESV